MNNHKYDTPIASASHIARTLAERANGVKYRKSNFLGFFSFTLLEIIAQDCLHTVFALYLIFQRQLLSLATKV